MHVFFAVVTLALLGADPSEKQVRYDEQAKAATVARIAEIEEELSSLEKSLRARHYASRYAKKAVAGKIKATKAELKELQAGKLVVPALQDPYTPGKIGKPLASSARVVRIIGPAEMLAEMTTIYPDSVRNESGVDRIVRGAQVNYEMLIRGLQTSLLSNGAATELPKLMEVTGEYTYQRADGTGKTVMVFSPFSLDEPAIKKE